MLELRGKIKAENKNLNDKLHEACSHPSYHTPLGVVIYVHSFSSSPSYG